MKSVKQYVLSKKQVPTNTRELWDWAKEIETVLDSASILPIRYNGDTPYAFLAEGRLSFGEKRILRRNGYGIRRIPLFSRFQIVPYPR